MLESVNFTSGLKIIVNVMFSDHDVDFLQMR